MLEKGEKQLKKEEGKRNLNGGRTKEGGGRRR